MAPQDEFNPLRVVTQRLSSTPCKQLPHVAPYLATTIAQYGNSLAPPAKEGQISGETDFAVIIHKLKTQLSALLQDKNPEARYAAVVLIKPTIETGGWNVLQGVGAWVRGLIGILGKPDCPSTKHLCIITLTRIFRLTHEHQSLVREITTPSLPGFITACLNLTKNPRSSKAAPEPYIQNSLLLAILHALNELIVMHPTSFRPFVPQLQSLTLPLIAPTPSSLENGNEPYSTSASISESARHLLVLLHVSGPKNTAGEEWARSLDALMISVHRTADKVFRSLIEDWTSPVAKYDAANLNPVEDVVSDQAPAPLALPVWTGIHAGIERFDGLLRTLQTFLATATATAITLPAGDILNLVDRVLSISPPGNGRKPRLKPEISRDEREGLWVGLPRLQVSVIGVCSLLISRMGYNSAAVSFTIIEQLFWTFEAQYGNDGFREAAYTLVSQILSMFGSSLPKTYSIPLSRCIRMCCEDLLPSPEPQLQGGQASFYDTKIPSTGITNPTNSDSYFKSATVQVAVSVVPTNLLKAAQELLPLTLTNTTNELLPFSLRCQIDRTAIIANNRQAMMASVMSPVSKRQGQNQTSSILPLLARAHPEALEVEALLRPQMPPIQSRRSVREVDSDGEKDTYMHDHSQIGESDGLYDDLAGTNGDANFGRSYTGHGELLAEATSGAVEENSPVVQPTDDPKRIAPGSAEPMSAFSYTSTKRDREEESNSHKEDFAEVDREEQVEIGQASKRSRVDSNLLRKKASREPEPANATIRDTGGTVEGVKKAFVSQSAAVSDRVSVLQQEGSDESEFEMPVLNLDPDTDEEDEEDDN